MADDDFLTSQRLKEFLAEKGFEVRFVSNGRALRDLVRDWSPHFVLADLILPEGNAVSVLEWMRSNPDIKKKDIKFLVTSSHNSVNNVKTCLAAGAADYVIKPFRFEDILQRLVFHINAKRNIGDSDGDRTNRSGADVFLHLIDLMLRECLSNQPVQHTLFQITRMVAITLKAVRCSVVLCDQEQLRGSVLASSDDRSVTGLQLDLNRYPEVVHVMNTEKIVVIENMDYDPVLAEIKKQIKGIAFNSMIVCPIRRQGNFFGVISARMDKNTPTLKDHEVRFARLASYAISMVVERMQLPQSADIRQSA